MFVRTAAVFPKDVSVIYNNNGIFFFSYAYFMTLEVTQLIKAK